MVYYEYRGIAYEICIGIITFQLLLIDLIFCESIVKLSPFSLSLETFLTQAYE